MSDIKEDETTETAPQEASVEEPRGRLISLRTALVMSIVSAVIGGAIVVGALAGYLTIENNRTTETSNTVVGGTVKQTTLPVKSDGTLNPQEIYDRFGQAVVHVQATITQVSTDFFGVPYRNQGRSDGSGFIVDGTGYIVTNAHVVDNAGTLTIILADESKYTAKLIGIDRSSDLALLKIDSGKKALTVIQLADSAQVKVGDTAYAIGNPFNQDGSMTSGIVSAIGRQIEAPNGFTIRNVIQTDAAVNPGNSGGPLIDSFGQVIGVNAQIEAQNGQFAGIAFAIPSNTVKMIIAQLKNEGKASHAWLGIQGMDITPEFVEKEKLGVDAGVLVSDVVKGSPAESAGLKGATRDNQGRVSGDILVDFNGIKVPSMDDLLTMIEKHKVGDKVKLGIVRNGKRESIAVTLSNRPQELSR